MWKYLRGVLPPKKRKSDDEGVSDTKSKMKKIRQFSKDENISIIVDTW